MVNKKDGPKYQTLEKIGNFEIRQYEPRVIAETVIEDNFEQAIKEGFNILAAYIFGQNATKTKIAMTAPVEQKLEMTRNPKQKNWLIAFCMPAKYKIEELPLPKNSRIVLKQIKAQKMAAFAFSGLCRENTFKENTNFFLKVIKQRGYTPIGSCIFARYDPPWTLPCFRHNELLFVIK